MYNITFSRGTRQCVGMNLANAELYLTLSLLFRRFDMELWDTDERAVTMVAEFFLPRTEEGREVMVKVMKIER